MLYERWLAVARAQRGEPALFELSAGRVWTFDQLARAAEQGPTPTGPLAYPCGQTAEFVLTVLRAWRAGQVVCPLEPDQAPPAVPPPPPGVVHLKTTSATTGPARCIAFTADQLAADADQLVPTMGLRPERPNLGAISLAHSYGFSNLITPLLLHGIPLLLPGSPLPEAVRRAAAAVPEVTLPGVPALWRAWHEADAIPDNVHLALSAGAPLPLALEEAVFAARGLKIHNFYGSSECGGIAYDATDVPRSDPAVVGTAVRGVALRVSEVDGCLEVRSPAVGQTYWPLPDPALAGGCFHTQRPGRAARGRGSVARTGQRYDQRRGPEGAAGGNRTGAGHPSRRAGMRGGGAARGRAGPWRRDRGGGGAARDGERGGTARFRRRPPARLAGAATVAVGGGHLN
jgi:acyl-CoA synthetase (AMP-forming)/AMP-acid ligase II